MYPATTSRIICGIGARRLFLPCGRETQLRSENRKMIAIISIHFWLDFWQWVIKPLQWLHYWMSSISLGLAMYNYSFNQQEPQFSSKTNYYLESKHQMNDTNNKYGLE